MLTMGRPLKMGGNAWSYLVDSVAGEARPGRRRRSLLRRGQGTPPGRFLGRGLDGLGPGPGSVKAGDVVSPRCCTACWPSWPTRSPARPWAGSPRRHKAPVAGFDMTFRPPKSVSLMWAMGDQATRAAIEEVMSEALAEVIAWAEDHVFFTRTGAQGARQESVRGVVASTWLHYESRDGDAQLHHHAWFGTEPRPSPTGGGAPWTAGPCTPGWWPCPSATSAWSRTS